MNNFIHNCGNELYPEDKYCTKCGEEIDIEFKTLQIPEYKPDIFQPILTEFPNPEIFTGYVTEAYHYQRSPGDSNIEYSYWFITLDKGNGEQKQINISSEDPLFDSVKVGDVLTVCRPTNVSIFFKIKYTADEKKVLNNELSGITVFYKGDKIIPNVHGIYEPNHFSLSSTFYSTLIPAIIIWLSFGLNIESAFIGSIIGLALGIYVYRRKKRSHLKTMNTYNTLADFALSLRNISASSLGFNKQSRTKCDDDVLCTHCNCRNTASFSYCVNCGFSSASLTHAFEEDDIQYQPIGKQISKILGEHEFREQFEFKLKRFLLPDLKVKGNRIVQMFRVVNREVGTNVNRWAEEHVTETEYRSSSGGYSHTNTRASYSYHRTSALEGTLSVEDSAGRIIELSVSSSLLKGTDIGDYLLCGWTDLATPKKLLHSSMEFAVNLNKDIKSQGNRLSDVKVKQDYLVYLFQAIALGSLAVGWYFDSLPLAIGIWTSMFTIMATMILIKKHSNKKNLKAQNQPLWDLRESIMQKCDVLIEKLSVLR